MGYKIALVTPEFKNDYLTDTVIDGLVSLREELDLEFYAPAGYLSRVSDFSSFMETIPFLEFASRADLILFFWGKGNTNFELINRINRFDKTVFTDGSEVGGNKRLDESIVSALKNGTYEGNGKVDKEMLEKCALYFKREKPYLTGVIPFPFGIQRVYSKNYSKDLIKDIDFFCNFGQEEFPPLRREVKEAIVSFCEKNHFAYSVEKTSQEDFYKNLARAKVGVSIGGGGFDTARFWEILGNNCLLMTESLDIYEPNSKRLNYERIWQFKDLEGFKSQLEKMGEFLRNNYKQGDLDEEYQTIIREHSSKARVLEILEKAREKGIIE